jgi:phage-related minor tail protein
MSLGQLGEANVAIRATLEQLDKDLAGARSTVDRAVRGIGSHVQTIGKTLLTGVVVGVLAVGAAAGATALHAVSMARDFQDATRAIVVGTGASGQALAEMEQITKNLAGTSAGLGQDFGTLGEVVAEVQTRTGATGEALETLSSQILNVSRITGGDAVENTRRLTRTMGDWDIQMENSGQLVDLLFAASQETGIGFDTLAEKLVQFGAPLRAMDFSIEESVALLGKWEKEGVNTELVLGSLRIAMGNFARDNIPMREGLENTIAAITEMGPGAEATALAMEVFGARAGPDMAAAILEGRFSIEELVDVLGDSAGAMDDAANRSLTFADRLDIIKSRAGVALMPLGQTVLDLGERIFPIIERVLDEHVIPALDKMAHFVEVLVAGLEGGIDPLTAIENALMAAFGPEITASVMDVVGSVQEIVEQVQEFMATAWEALEPVVAFIAEFVEWQDVAVAMAIAIGSVVIPAIWAILSPVLAIIAVGVALIAAISIVRRAWTQDWGGIRTALTDAWNNHIQPALAALQRWIVDEVIPTVQNLYRRWVDEWWPQISAALGQAWDFISDIFSNLKRWVTEELIPTVIDLYTTWSERWDQIQTALQNVWTIIEEIFTEVGRWLNDNLGPWVEVLAELWAEKWAEIQAKLEEIWAIVLPIFELIQEWMKEKIAEALDGLERKWKEVMGALEEPIEKVRDIWQKFVDAVQGFWNWITGKEFNFKINLPDLPSWALPGSPLPIHVAWADFEQEMKHMRIAPQFELPASERALMPGGSLMATAGGTAPVTINVDARGATEPGAVRRAARTAVDEALRAAGLATDQRRRTIG